MKQRIQKLYVLVDKEYGDIYEVHLSRDNARRNKDTWTKIVELPLTADQRQTLASAAQVG